MKRSVIAAVICLGMLTGCGRVDTAPVDSSPVEITASETTKITAAADKDESETTVKTESKQTTENTKETKSSGTTTSTANAQLVRRSSPAVTRQTAAAPAPVRTAAKTAAAPATTTKITGNAPVQTTLTSTTVTTTTSAQDNDPKIVSKDNIVCEVKKDGVDVFIDGENMHTIEADTKAMLDVYETNEITQESLITIFDFNGDSVNDIFIPTEISKDSVSGVYYRYDAEEKKYVEWEEMKDIKKLINVSKTDYTFTILDKKDSVEYEERLYGWDDEKKPVLRKMQKQYNASADPWDILIDYYEYPDGEEKLVKREKLVFNDAHEITDTQEVELD